jgi:predicted dehydrogenase
LHTQLGGFSVAEISARSSLSKPLHAAKGQANATEADYLGAKAVLGNWDRDQVNFGVNYNYRTMPHLRRLKADVATGRLGDMKATLVWAHFACWSHVIDQLRWILGEVESGSALRSPVSLERVATLRFASGCIGTLCGTSGRFERSALLRVELHGTEAQASVEGVHGTYRRDYENDNDSVAWTNPDVSGAVYATSFEESVAAYCDALRTGTSVPVSGDDGLAELAIEAAIDRSCRTEVPERVPPL